MKAVHESAEGSARQSIVRLLLYSAAFLVVFFGGYELVERLLLTEPLSSSRRELLHVVPGITAATLLATFVGWYLIRQPVRALAPRHHSGLAFDSPARRAEQVRWLIRMRWAGAAFTLILIVAAVPVAGVLSATHVPALLAWLAILVAWNCYFASTVEHDPHYERQVIAQMVLDAIVITGLLNASGGIENPLSIAYLFGVFIAGVLLSRRDALLVTVTAAGAMTSLALGELFRLLPHAAMLLFPHNDRIEGMHHAAHDPVFVFARLTSLLGSMFVTAYFTILVVERLRASERDLRDTATTAMLDRARLEGVIEAAGLGIVIIGLDRGIVWINARLLSWIASDPSIPDAFLDAADETLRSGEVREIEVASRAGGDGTVRHFRHATFPLRDENGDVLQAVHLVEDITNRKELEAEALHASRLAVIGQLAAGIAHEIGNPLASLHARVQLMRRRPEPELIHESADVLERQIERIGRIVRGVSHLARSGAGSRGTVDVDSVVREAVSLVEMDRRAKAVIVRCSFAALPPVRGARDELMQVVLNLLLNAVEAMSGGGTLEVTTSAADGHVRIAIGDSGAGIDAAVRARLFQPFFTTKADGTGLGLSICQTLVRAHGGTIEVESDPGRGSRFTLVLPAQKVAEALAS